MDNESLEEGTTITSIGVLELINSNREFLAKSAERREEEHRLLELARSSMQAAIAEIRKLDTSRRDRNISTGLVDRFIKWSDPYG